MSDTGSRARKIGSDEAPNAIEERLRLIVDTIPTIVWRKSPDGSADFFNKTFREYTGLSLEDGMGWGWMMNAFHPDDRLQEEWRAALATGKPFEKEARLRRADGQYRWFLIRAVPLRDEHGSIVSWYGTTNDIEDLKRAEDRVRLIINTIPTMTWSLRPDGTVDFVNQRWVDYTGLTLEQEVEAPTRPVHPEDLPRVMKKWLADMAAGEPSEDEIRLRRADGEYRWFLVRTAPLRDARGCIVKWYGVSIDIEDRKRAENLSRELIDAIPQQIWSGPPDGTLDYCNSRWRSYMGLTLEDLRGHGWQTMLHPEDRDRVLSAWHDSVVTGTPYEQEERHRRADGTYRWFLARGVPLRDPQGRIVRWYGTNTDIEDRKQAEEAVRRLSGQLLQLQDEERRRIARELHDSTGQDLVVLATMLGGQLRGAIPSSDRKAHKLLSECRALAERCIREVRTLSYVLHPPVLDEAGLEEAIRDYAQGFARRSGVQVELDFSPALGRMTRAVELALFRVVQEALSNIHRHSKNQRAKIQFHANSNLTLEISDFGPASSADPRRGVEARFDVGVGIQSMRERVKLIGGRLDIESTGQGTIVRVTIPLGRV